jgi:hypothetical protein
LITGAYYMFAVSAMNIIGESGITISSPIITATEPA